MTADAPNGVSGSGPSRPRMLRVGLTGGIACGKSVVLRHLKAPGMATIDLDLVAHEVLAPGGAAHADVVAAFGEGILAPDATIDRRALAAVVFRDAQARAQLDALVHPRVRAEEARRVARLEAEGLEVVVSDAALLVEAGVHLRFDRLVVVHCGLGEQMRRLVARDGLDEGAAQARIDAQMPVGEKRGFAHLEVDTEGPLEETETKAQVLAGVLLTEARSPRPPRVFLAGRALGGLAPAGPAGPRGLSAQALLGAALQTGGLEMPALVRRLDPPARGAWYRVAREGEREPWPEALAVPLALWGLARGGDEEWLLGAAASLARLTHVEGEAITGACLAALAARRVGSAGSLRPLEEGFGDGEERARRWGGAATPRRVRRCFAAALEHPDDPAAAGEAAVSEGGEPSLAAGLVGLAKGAVPRLVDPALSRLVEGLS